MRVVILLSSTRPEGVSTLLVLPVGARILAHFPDDGSTRDVTRQAADLITEYVLRGGAGEESPDASSVEVAQLEIVDGGKGLVRMALIDLRRDVLEEIPAERLLPLLAGAIGMAIADAVQAEEPASETAERSADETADQTADQTADPVSEPAPGQS
jgi:hypothetical protein